MLCYCSVSLSGINSSASVELRHPSADQLVQGAEVSLRCQAEGHPEPSVEWYRNRNRYERLHSVVLLVHSCLLARYIPNSLSVRRQMLVNFWSCKRTKLSSTISVKDNCQIVNQQVLVQ